MNSQTRRILPSEWEIWKATILDLTHQKPYTLKKVMAIMKDKHDFNASTSQYEAQLGTWRIRKNLSADEWANVFEIVDKLESQHKETSIFISGEEVSKARLQRSRRKYNKEKHRIPNRIMPGRSAGLRNASIKIRGTDGNWTPYTNPGNVVDHAQNQAPDAFSSSVASVVSNTSTKTGPNVEQVPHGQVYNNVDIFGMGTSLHSDLSHVSGPKDLYESVVGEEPWPIPRDVPLLSPSMVISQQIPQHEPPIFDDIDFGSPSCELKNWAKSPNPLFSPVPREFYTPVRCNLDALSFEQFMEDLGAPGNNSLDRSLNFDSTHFSAIQSPISLFQADIISSMSENDLKQSDKRSSDATYLWSSLRSLLPNVDPQGGSDSGESLMTEDEMLQIKLDQILLYSAANGFVGLEEIPIQSVLKYLSRYADIDLLLKASHSHVGKAIAENLFRAAIEAKDKGALKYLLAIPSIDVNSIICINGRKYTPVERAATLQDLGIVQIFLDAGADVKKTCGLNPLDGGILGKLVNSIGWDVRVPPEVIEIGKVLLRAGAKLHLEIIKRALQAHNLPKLAYSLVSSVSDSDHAELIRSGFLSLIAVHLDDWQATQATKNIIMACERTKCQTCKISYNGELDWALIQGAKRGHLELVKLLLLHSKTPHRALSAAIRSDRSEIIDTILTLNPDINAPAHSIDDEKWKSQDWMSFQATTTSYAEAIEVRNEKLLLEMEGKGALELLSEGTRFEPAIAAASRIGDIVYVRKLLKCCPYPKPSHMTRALLSAVQIGHEEVFRTLVAAGADVNLPDNSSRSPDPLFTAVCRRNSGMVSAVLNADPSNAGCWRSYSYKGVRTTILEEAVKWGNRAIIQELLFAFPGATMIREGLCTVLDKGDMAHFEFLLGCGVASISALTSCLKIGLSRGDAELVQNLVERGADPIDPYIFATCIEKYPAMLPLLCEQIPSRKSHHILSGFGTDALKAAIRLGQAGLAAVKLLLGLKVVDAKSFSGDLFETAQTPLGLAIKVSRKGHHADFEVIRKLLEYGCDPNSIVTHLAYSTPNVKQTAILEAIDTGSTDLVKLLIDSGAEINQEANLGLKRTPLQKAVEVDSLEIVTLLLEMGVDVNARPADRGGATAFQLAAIRGNCIIADKLLHYGANLHAPPAHINGRWPLEGAAENGRIRMIFFLWEVNKDWFGIKECRKAMELAEGNGYMACRARLRSCHREGWQLYTLLTNTSL